MAKAEHQAAWRAKSQRTRVEIHLTPEEVARLDSLGGTRAEAIRGLLATNQTLPEYEAIPDDALDQLRAAFPDQGAAYGVDWTEAAKVAAMTAERRRGDKERQRRCRERRKVGKDQAPPTS